MDSELTNMKGTLADSLRRGNKAIRTERALAIAENTETVHMWIRTSKGIRWVEVEQDRQTRSFRPRSDQCRVQECILILRP